jgi:beta-lactamase superfamily II metal-dependent hydrolase
MPEQTTSITSPTTATTESTTVPTKPTQTTSSTTTSKPDDDPVDDPVTEHNYEKTVTPPTCTEEGYTTYTCTICGDTYVSDKVSPEGHDHEATITPPTCEEDGYSTYVCFYCGDTYVADVKAPKGHSWKEATTAFPKTCIICGKTEGDKLIDDLLYVHYIDVGQGDSILIKFGDCDILIDAGIADYGTRVSNYLKNLGVDDIELMINTHADADHCGGLTQVLTSFVVEEVWASPLTKTTAAYKNFDSAIKKEGLTKKNPQVGTVYTYESLTLTVLYDGSGTSDANDSSIVVMLQYGSRKFLFTGDISSTIEKKLVSSKVDLKCDVLKVAHHGSRYSSDSSFLNATGAKYGVICVGADNDYGHPTSQALNRLASAGLTVYRTDKNGNVVFSTDGSSLNLPESYSAASASAMNEQIFVATTLCEIRVDMTAIIRMKDCLSYNAIK